MRRAVCRRANSGTVTVRESDGRRVRSAGVDDIMKNDQPTTPEQWVDEIRLAIAEARKAKRFGWLLGRWMTDAKLFHFAPVLCLKYRGLDYRDEELRRKVTEGALANYVVNSDEEGIDHGLRTRPLLAFAVCYVTAHYVLDLIDDRETEALLDYLEQKLG